MGLNICASWILWYILENLTSVLVQPGSHQISTRELEPYSLFLFHRRDPWMKY